MGSSEPKYRRFINDAYAEAQAHQGSAAVQACNLAATGPGGQFPGNYSGPGDAESLYQYDLKRMDYSFGPSSPYTEAHYRELARNAFDYPLFAGKVNADAP